MKKIKYAWLIESNFNGAFLYLMVKCVLKYTLNNLTKKEKVLIQVCLFVLGEMLMGHLY